MISPDEMMKVLHAPYPERTRATLRWASLDMLRHLYQKNPDHPKVHEAKLALETGMSEWTDQEVADFLMNHLFEAQDSTDLQSKSPDELRRMLSIIYDYLFQGGEPLYRSVE